MPGDTLLAESVASTTCAHSYRALHDDRGGTLEVGVASHLDFDPEVGDEQTGAPSWRLSGGGKSGDVMKEAYRTVVLLSSKQDRLGDHRK